MITVLIVDDNPIIRMGLKSLLEDATDIMVADEASSGDEAIARISKSPINVVLMDIHMPGMNGIKATSEIMQIRPETRVLIITNLEDPTALAQAIAVGAKGCLVYSHFAPEELANAIRLVASDEKVVVSSSAIPDRLDLASDNSPEQQHMEPLPGQYPLTRRELSILNLIIEGKSNAEIAEALSIAEKTVKNHINSLYSKLHVKNRYEAIVLRLKNQL